jgi:hypothetical protein
VKEVEEEKKWQKKRGLRDSGIGLPDYSIANSQFPMSKERPTADSRAQATSHGLTRRLFGVRIQKNIYEYR